jgi:hypothetical protein
MHFQTAQLVAVLIGSVLPLLVGLVTKASWPAGLRAVLLLLLAGVTSFLTDWVGSLNGGPAFDPGVSLLAALGVFLAGVGLQFGFWKPTGLTNVVKRNGIRDEIGR